MCRPRQLGRRLLACMFACVASHANAQLGTPDPRGGPPGENAPAPASAPDSTPRSLDAFDGISAWKALPSDGVEATIRSERRDDAKGNCLRLDFNFKTGGGFVVVRRTLAMPMPANYEFSFDVRGECLSNNFEFKLIDDGATRGAPAKSGGGVSAQGDAPDAPVGESVWWVNRRAFEFPREWTRIAYKRRHLGFAWGPSAGAPLTNVGAIEFAIASAEGGKGTVWIDEMSFRELPEVRPYSGRTTAKGASRDASHGAEMAIDGNSNTAWAPARGASFELDYGQVREITGLVLRWGLRHDASPTAFAPDYSIDYSIDGANWQRVASDRPAFSDMEFVYTPDADVRFVRINGPANEFLCDLSEIEVLETSEVGSLNQLITACAKRLPRGMFPRWAYGEQSFWTVLGAPDDTNEALINEEGQIEVGKLGYSLEPFVRVGESLLTWADGTHTQSLAQGRLPIATVVRDMKDLRLTVRAGVHHPRDLPALVAQYTVTNKSTRAQDIELLIAVRPYQVNPPAQFLNIEGGASPIRELGGIPKLPNGQGLRTDAGFRVNGRSSMFVAGALDVPSHTFFYMPGGWDAVGEAAGFGWSQCTPHSDRMNGVITVQLSLAPGASVATGVVATFDQDRKPKWHPASREMDIFGKLLDDCERSWEQRCAGATLRLPPSARVIEDTFYAQQAYILINKDGPGFQPGSRSYERSWIRDGSMTSAAMLQLGHDQLAKDFVDWYASFQFPDGKVPCVVDKRGPDPVPEHDSHGQLIMAIANVHRYTGDLSFVQRHMPHVQKAVAYIESLRAQRSGPDYADNSGKTRQEPGKPAVPLAAFRGLVPESISHEGYSAKPMHSYWDDLFIYRGLKDAAYLARVTGDELNANRWQSLAHEFGRDLAASYALAMKTHGIDYLPGCVELGDFDATSTTVALWPVQAAEILPQAALHRTFDKYWEFFTNRRDNPREKWEAYTPYELRVINAFTHLGQRERAFAALEWFMLDQYPKGWHHWAEVVWSNPRTPKFIGDMPHTWCGSDFLNSLRSMLVYEDEASDSLVLFAGVPDAWKNAEEGLSFNAFRTYYGPLSASIARHERGHRVRIESPSFRMPEGGLVLRWDDAKPPRATINGRSYEGDARNRPGDIVIRSLPADVVIIDD